MEREFLKLKKSTEKQTKDQIKATQRQVREKRTRTISSNIIDGFSVVSGFTELNQEGEEILQGVINQYDGNKNYFMNFDDSDKLPSQLRPIAPQYIDVLIQTGMVVRRFEADNMDFLTLTYSGLNYFKNKEETEDRAQAEKERKEKLETDIVKIQSMSVDQLRDIYIQAVQANALLKSSLDLYLLIFFQFSGNPIAVVNFSSVRVEAFLTVLLISLMSSFLNSLNSSCGRRYR